MKVCPHGVKIEKYLFECDPCFEEHLEAVCERIEWAHLYIENGGEG